MLETALRHVQRLQLPDPHGTVTGGAADGLAAARDDGAGCSGQAPFGPCIEQSEAPSEEHILEAGNAVGGVDLAQHRRAVVVHPVDGALRLAQRRLPGLRPGSLRWLRVVTRRDARQRAAHGEDRGFGHFVAIQAALARAAHRKRCAGPHRPGVELRLRLQHRDAPGGDGAQDRPVERTRAAVAGRPGMNDETPMSLPY